MATEIKLVVTQADWDRAVKEVTEHQDICGYCLLAQAATRHFGKEMRAGVSNIYDMGDRSNRAWMLDQAGKDLIYQFDNYFDGHDTRVPKFPQTVTLLEALD